MAEDNVHSDQSIRSAALDHATRLFEAMAANRLFVAGKVSEQDVLGAAQVFYAFLKGEQK